MKDAPFDSACMPKCYQGESVEKCHVCLSARRMGEPHIHLLRTNPSPPPQDMMHLSPAPRISALSVSIIAKGGGCDRIGDGRGGYKIKYFDCALIRKYRDVFAFHFSNTLTLMLQCCQVWLVLTHSFLFCVSFLNKKNMC